MTTGRESLWEARIASNEACACDRYPYCGCGRERDDDATAGSETVCDDFRFAGVHPDGGSRLCKCGLKYDEHRPAAQAKEPTS